MFLKTGFILKQHLIFNIIFNCKSTITEHFKNKSQATKQQMAPKKTVHLQKNKIEQKDVNNISQLVEYISAV